MIVYGLYKNIGARHECGNNLIMAHHDITSLRTLGNAYFADPSKFVTRFKRQLVIPDGEMRSNIECADGGGQVVYVSADIRLITEVPDPTIYGVWEYHNGWRHSLIVADTDIDTLRNYNNAREIKRQQEGHRGCVFFADGAMKSDTYRYNNGDRMYEWWYQIEPLPSLKEGKSE